MDTCILITNILQCHYRLRKQSKKRIEIFFHCIVIVVKIKRKHTYAFKISFKID